MMQRMPETLERVARKTRHAALCFHFPFRQHDRPLVGRARASFFPVTSWRSSRLISTFGLIALWEFYGMLDHKGLPNFKITAMICGAVMLCGSFYYFSRIGPGAFLRFRDGGVALFSADGFYPANVRQTARRRAAADDGLHAFRPALRPLALQFHHQDRLRHAALADGRGDGAVLLFSICIAITKFSDMGAYLTGSLIGRHQLIPHISPKKTWEGFFGALAFSLLASVGLVPADAGAFVGA